MASRVSCTAAAQSVTALAERDAVLRVQSDHLHLVFEAKRYTALVKAHAVERVVVNLKRDRRAWFDADAGPGGTFEPTSWRGCVEARDAGLDETDDTPDIARAYRRMADEAGGRVNAEITSATALPPDAVAKIKTALEKATGKQIVATTSVDPELIGGVVAKVGSYVVDGSVRTALAQMKVALTGA